MGRMVVIVANLKPRNMRGIRSNGMLLCTSNPDHSEVEPLVVPEGAKVGERVWFGLEPAQPEAWAPNKVQKKKAWEAVSQVREEMQRGGRGAVFAVVAGEGGMRASALLADVPAGPEDGRRQGRPVQGPGDDVLWGRPDILALP